MSSQRKSLRARVNAMCKWCIYDQRSGIGTWRQQVGACTATDCPLYDVRPMPDERGNECESSESEA